ncbi:hypothetical protein HK101_004345, partial [Irineochytrium annulatum]
MISLDLRPSFRAQVAHYHADTLKPHPFFSNNDASLPGAVSPLTVWQRAYTEFTAEVHIGNPPQPLNLLLDTGSSHLWVRSNRCQSEACVNATSFDSFASESFLPSSTPAIPIRYVDGTNITGSTGSDDIFIGAALEPEAGGSTPNTMEASKGTGGVGVRWFDFMLADVIESPYPDEIKSDDGTLGMSLHSSDSSIGTQPTFMDQIMAQGALGNYLVSFYIDTTDRSGSVTFGGYDLSTLEDPLLYPVQWCHVIGTAPGDRRVGKWGYNDQGFFSLELYSIQTSSPPAALKPSITSATSTVAATQKVATATVGLNITTPPPSRSFNATANITNVLLLFPSPHHGTAIIDTGTSSARLPQPILTSIALALNATTDPIFGSLHAPCSLALTHAPLVTLHLSDGVSLVMTGKEYMVPDARGPDSCLINLSGVDEPVGGWGGAEVLIGNTVLKRYVTVFDYKAAQVGFGLAKGRVEMDGGVGTPPRGANLVVASGARR